MKKKMINDKLRFIDTISKNVGSYLITKHRSLVTEHYSLNTAH